MLLNTLESLNSQGLLLMPFWAGLSSKEEDEEDEAKIGNYQKIIPH